MSVFYLTESTPSNSIENTTHLTIASPHLHGNGLYMVFFESEILPIQIHVFEISSINIFNFTLLNEEEDEIWVETRTLKFYNNFHLVLNRHHVLRTA